MSSLVADVHSLRDQTATCVQSSTSESLNPVSASIQGFLEDEAYTSDSKNTDDGKKKESHDQNENKNICIAQEPPEHRDSVPDEEHSSPIGMLHQDGQQSSPEIVNFEGDIIYKSDGSAIVVHKSSEGRLGPDVLLESDSKQIDSEASNPLRTLETVPTTSETSSEESLEDPNENRTVKDPEITITSPTHAIQFLTFFKTPNPFDFNNVSSSLSTFITNGDVPPLQNASCCVDRDASSRLLPFPDFTGSNFNYSGTKSTTAAPIVSNFLVHTLSDVEIQDIARKAVSREPNDIQTDAEAVETVEESISNSPGKESVDQGETESKEYKDSLFKRLLNSASVGEVQVTANSIMSAESCRRKPILMCFPCRLTFGFTRSYLLHARDEHDITPNDRERQMLKCSNISSVIQKIVGGKCLICFLEPVNRLHDLRNQLDQEKSAPNEEKECDDERPRENSVSSSPFNDSEESKLVANAELANELSEFEPQSVTENQTTEKLSDTRTDDYGKEGKNNEFVDSVDNLNMDRDIEENTTTNEIASSERCSTEKLTVDAASGIIFVDQTQPEDSLFADTRASPETISEVTNQEANLEELEPPSPDRVPSMPAHADIPHTENVKIHQTAEDLSNSMPNDKGSELVSKHSTSEGGGSLHLTQHTHMPKTSNAVSGPMSETIFSGVGGMATVDPMFQMSIFQSRNSCKTLKCPRCNWHYKYRQTLDAHMKEKHAEDISDCVFCKANQPHPRLSRGESYACGYKPFKCELCNYSTTTKGNLSIHMQSDKHLYNEKTMQHHQQKNTNGQASSSSAKTSANPSTLSGRLLTEKEQLQNYMHQQQLQARKRSSPDMVSNIKTVSTRSPKFYKTAGGNSGEGLSPASSPFRKSGAWRCDVCNYQTDYARNLRIHKQSEKHSQNVMFANAESARRVATLHTLARINSHKLNADSGDGESSDLDEANSEARDNDSEAASLAGPLADQNGPPSNMLALYYTYLAALQSSMQGQAGDSERQDDENERQKQQQQSQNLLAQQQMLVAQQYQQILASQLTTGDASAAKPAFLQQQFLMQQQFHLWRQLLSQAGDSRQTTNVQQHSPHVMQNRRQGDMTSSPSEYNNSQPSSKKFLFTCGVCCQFFCNDLESLCAHVRSPRCSRTSFEDCEWVSRSPADGFLCRLCNYKTPLKTNFSLHCKTEKHTSKLQLINHIKEGGASNEWKISSAIAGINMQNVTCNGCRHSANSIDKLRIHCSTERHQGTLSMCNYLDTLMKDAEVGKGLRVSEDISSLHLSCRPCSYQSKFVVEMVQHMQCQEHHFNVHQEQQRGSIDLTDMIAAEKDGEKDKDNEMVEDRLSGRENDEKADIFSNGEPSSMEECEEQRTYNCPFCNYNSSDEKRLRLHVMTQHNDQPALKCPKCPTFLNDAVHFRLHLIQAHNIPMPEQGFSPSRPENIQRNGILETSHADPRPEGEGLLQVKDDTRPSSRSEIPETSMLRTCHDTVTVVNSDENDEEVTPLFVAQCQHCGETLKSKVKWQLHMEVHRIQASAAASSVRSNELKCSRCQSSFSDIDQYKRHKKTHHVDNTDLQSSVTSTSSSVLKGQTESESNHDSVFMSPNLLLKIVCSDSEFAQTVVRDSRFTKTWEKLGPPYTCSPCQETFVSRSDLLDHIMSSNNHCNIPTMQESVEPVASRDQGLVTSEQTSEKNTVDEEAKSADEEESETKGEKDYPDSKIQKTDVVRKDDTVKHDEQVNDCTEDESKICTIFDFSSLESAPRNHRLLYPGISKVAHRHVLAEIGLDHIKHFVENRTNENREKAKLWKSMKETSTDDKKGEQGNNEDNCKTTDETVTPQEIGEAKNVEGVAGNQQPEKLKIDEGDNILDTVESSSGLPTSRESGESLYCCNRCGKEFSEIWVLKTHLKSVHNSDLPLELVEQFTNAYFEWYWKHTRKDIGNKPKNPNRNEYTTKFLEGRIASQNEDEDTQNLSKHLNETKSALENTTLDSMRDDFEIKDDKGFQQVALEAIMKNYPNLLDSYSSGSTIQQSTSTTEQSARLQQQMLLQMLMTAQSQSSAMQNASSDAVNQKDNHSESSGISEMLSNLYASAAMRMNPGYMDSISASPMNLNYSALAQAQAHAMGLTPYHWLAIAAAQQQQQQQQLQHLLMYSTLGNSAVPFMQNMNDNSNQPQQQILASLAANLLSSSNLENEIPSSTEFSSSAAAVALQAYQLQSAVATATSLTESQMSKENEDTIVQHQRLRGGPSSSSLPANSSEIPAKRPRTRITDNQLKILRANFDINTSPSETQISDMAIKTNLPPKVIKHWFRNTLFKERQRSKDSPYNFNIPPMTLFEETGQGVPARSSDADQEDNNNKNCDSSDGTARSEASGSGSQAGDEERKPIFVKFPDQSSAESLVNKNPYLNASRASLLTRNRSPSLNSNKGLHIFSSPPPEQRSSSAEMQQTLFTNALSLMPSLSESTNREYRDSKLDEKNNAIDSADCQITSVDFESRERIKQYLRQDMPLDSITGGMDHIGRTHIDYHPSMGSLPSISRRTPRTRFSDYQLKVLQDFFDRNAYPKDEDLDKLSHLLDLSTRVIVVWFQNARQKARKSYEMQQQQQQQQNNSAGGMSYAHKQTASDALRRPSHSPVPKNTQEGGKRKNSAVEQQDSYPSSNSNSSKYSAFTVHHRESPVEERQEQKINYPDLVKKEKTGTWPGATTAEDSESDDKGFRCRQCDIILPSLHSLQQHESLHTLKPAYLSTFLQHYRMYSPSLLQSIMQSSSSSSIQDQPDEEVGKDQRHFDTTDQQSRTIRSPHSPVRSRVQEDEKSFPPSFVRGQRSSENNPRIKIDPVNTEQESERRHFPADGHLSKVLPYESKAVASNLGSRSGVQSISVNTNYVSSVRDFSSASGFSNKQKSSISPTFSMSSSSSTSPNSNRQHMNPRRMTSDNSKDNKRLRTTISPEQLEFLYQQYLVDSSPSRKVIEQISEVVRLKKRVVQVWFQNTRARERKGQFRAVGKINSVLNRPQVCPHCQVTYRTKADLDAHVRYRHMQSPAAVVAPNVNLQGSDATSVSSSASLGDHSVTPSTAITHHSNLRDYASPGSIFSISSASSMKSFGAGVKSSADFGNLNNAKHSTKDEHHPSIYAQTSKSTATPSRNDSNLPSDDILDGCSPQKMRKISSESSTSLSNVPSLPHVALLPTIQSSITSPNKPVAFSVDAIAQRLSGKSTETAYTGTSATQLDFPSSVMTSSSTNIAVDPMSCLSPATSSPVSSPQGSINSSYMGVPPKRYRTQMTSLQIRSLKHCFAEYKTPTLNECESLGAHIALAKRVIQVWFQNARAKEKKAKNCSGDYENGDSSSVSFSKTICHLCPGMRFSSQQEYRDHVFSRAHLEKFTSSVEFDGSDDMSRSSGRRTPSSDLDEFQTRECTRIPSSSGEIMEKRYTESGSNYTVEHDRNVDEVLEDYSEHETSIRNGSPSSSLRQQQGPWNEHYASHLANNPALLQQYQIAALQKFMQAQAVQNGVETQKLDSTMDTSDSTQQQQEKQSMDGFKQAWLQQLLSAQRLQRNLTEADSSQKLETDVNNNSRN